MTTTEVFTEQDVDHLFRLMLELGGAGRGDDVVTVAKAYHLACSSVYPHLYEGEEEHEQFLQDFEEAERDIAEGRLIPHEEVLRRLQALDDASD